MNIFLKELSINKKSLFLWSLVLILFNVITMYFYPVIASNPSKNTLGITKIFILDEIDLSDIFQYFRSQGYIYITLFGSIYITMLSAGMLSKEETNKSIDFLLARPVSRKGIVTAKIFAIFTYTLIFNLLFSLSNFIIFEYVKKSPFNLNIFIFMSIGPFLLHLTFASIGLMFSIFVNKEKAIFSLSIGIVMGSFFLKVLSAMVKQLSILRYFSPFKYVDPYDILRDGTISLRYFSIMLTIIVICVYITYILYDRKNLSVR